MNAAALADPGLTARVWDLLDTVVDPCHVLSGHDISILDLGLVNSVELQGDEVQVSITLTEVSCTLGWRIIEQIESIADDLQDITAVRVRIDPFPVWTPDRMSERGRAHHEARHRAFIKTQALKASIARRRGEER